MALAIVAGLALLEAAYVLAGNLALETRFLRHLVNRDATMFAVEYRHAWTVVPGLVEVVGSHIRAQDSLIEWTLDVDRARFLVDPLALARRTVRFVHVRAEGATFRVRAKLDPLVVTAGDARLLPPIAGFADPPLRVIGPPTPDTPPDVAWAVEMHDADVGVREVWIHAVRLLGAGRLRAHGRGARLALGGNDFVLDQATYTLPGPGEVRVGPDVVLAGARGRLTLGVDRFDLSDALDPSVVAFFTGEARLRGRLADAGPLGALLGMRMRGGHGEIAAAIRLGHGVIRPPSWMTATASGLSVTLGGVGVRGDARLEIGFGRVLGLSARLSRVALTLPGATQAAVFSEAVRVTTRASKPVLTAPFSGATVWLRSAQVRAPSLAAIRLSRPGALVIREGSGTLDDVVVCVRPMPMRTTATGGFAARGLAVAITGRRLHGELRGRARIDWPPTGGARARGFVELSAVADDRPGGDRLTGRVDAPAVVVQGGRVTARLALRLHGSDDVLSALLGGGALPVPSPVLDVLDHDDLQGTVTVTATGRRVRIDDVKLRGENYRLRGRVVVGGGPTIGRALLDVGPLALGLAIHEGGTDLVAIGARRWFEARE